MSIGKVWVVASGYYSDYSIHIVCATEEVADGTAAAWNAATGNSDPNSYDHYYVEEHPFTTEVAPPVPVYHQFLTMCPDLDREARLSTFTDLNAPLEPEVDVFYDDGKPWVGRIIVRANDPERARKAAYDRLAYEKARMEGLT